MAEAFGWMPPRYRGGRPSGITYINRASQQAKGLALWCPMNNFVNQSKIGEFPLTYPNVNISLVVVPGYGLVLQSNTDNDTQIVVEDSINGKGIDPGLADPFTVSVWCDWQTGSSGTLIGKSGSTGSIKQFQLFNSGDTNLKCTIHGTELTFGALAIENQGPTLVTITKSGAETTNDVQCYLNGLFHAQGTAGTDATSNSDWLIGANRADDINTGTAFQSNTGDRLWDTRVYNLALTPAQAWQLFDYKTRNDLIWRPRPVAMFDVPVVGGPIMGPGYIGLT